MLLSLLLAAACSDGTPEALPPRILCAAESLHQARDAPSRAEEDLLRARSDIFARKLPADKRQRWWTEIDRLSDRRGTQPLIEASICEALLTDEDRRGLAASAVTEANTHQDAIGNRQ
ncbi:MAG TPA: hypothetical protein VFP12_10250 [Allosphingosinicella sp.]|nr:hypothetical protein [Allosphingosinicella sp.]